MTFNSSDMDTRAGIAGGFLLAVMANISTDILHTVIVAATGAVTSYAVSMLLGQVFRHKRR